MTPTDPATWRDEALGPRRELDLPRGRVAVHEAGSGPPIVFVHGLLVNANLWRGPVAHLSGDFRCVTLDLPLGSHLVSPGERLDPSGPGLADLVAEVIEALGLDDVTLVGNDTGGALCQMVVTRRSERIGRLVLTSCDYRDNFPPAMFSYFKPVARIPGAMKALMAPMRFGPPRRLPIAFGWLVKRPSRQAEDSYVLPLLRRPGVAGDVRRIVRALDKRHTNEAADRLGSFKRPVLIAWSRDDRFFPADDARRLAADLPNSRLEWIDDARTFSAEDQPERLAELIAGFVREPVAA